MQLLKKKKNKNYVEKESSKKFAVFNEYK